MSVKVFDINGATAQYDADAVEVNDDLLYVSKGEVLVSVYAAGKWVNADITADE